MTENDILHAVSTEVERKFNHESGGHDWWHIHRVWKMSKFIAEKEGANLFIVELAALLHDIADWKYHHGDEFIGGKTARSLLSNYPISESIVNEVVLIIDSLSFKGAAVETPMKSLEGKIVQDADRLDAIGAIGIARTFAYGGMKGRSMYDPAVKPHLHNTFEAYKNSVAPTINHFYEKLLLLKDRMNTETAKHIAVKRHTFMAQFLSQFYDEWEFCNNE